MHGGDLPGVDSAGSRGSRARSGSRSTIGSDSRTPYDRWMGKKVTQDTAESCEKVHVKLNLKGKGKSDGLDARQSEGHFLDKNWRTGEAIVRMHREDGRYQASGTAQRL